MANNYTEFSEELSDLTPEETTWLEDQLQVVHVYDGEEYPDDEVPERFRDAAAAWSGCRAYRDMDPDDYALACSEDAGFEYEFDGPELWFHAEEWVAGERLTHLIQKFLKQFRPDEYWSMTYANTCSKPRVGEFGGGGIFVTADNIVSENSYTFIEEQEKAFKLQRDVAKLVDRAEQAGIEVEDLSALVTRETERDAAGVDCAGVAKQIAWLGERLGLGAVEGHINEIAGKKGQNA